MLKGKTPLRGGHHREASRAAGRAGRGTSSKMSGESVAKRESTYTQRSFFSRGKAWSVDARRPFVSGASRTRNALASHGHRSRLPLTGRIAPRLYLSFSLSFSVSIFLSLCTLYARVLAYTYTLARHAREPPLAGPRWHRCCQLFKLLF